MTDSWLRTSPRGMENRSGCSSCAFRASNQNESTSGYTGHLHVEEVMATRRKGDPPRLLSLPMTREARHDCDSGLCHESLWLAGTMLQLATGDWIMRSCGSYYRPKSK